MMGEADEEELEMAFRMSLQQGNQTLPLPTPEPKRSKLPEEEVQEARERRIRRELRAAAAEKRISPAAAATAVPFSSSSSPSPSPSPSKTLTLALGGSSSSSTTSSNRKDPVETEAPAKQRAIPDSGRPLPTLIAEHLFTVVFGPTISKDVLAQWCNQGFRFSPDRQTSLGLVQREGGPCGVLAPVQAVILKYLLFVPESNSDRLLGKDRNLMHGGSPQMPQSVENDIPSELFFTDSQRTRALVHAMAEVLWIAGGKQRAVVVVLDLPGFELDEGLKEEEQDEMIAKALEGVSLDSAEDMQRFLRTRSFTSLPSLLFHLQHMLPGFRSRVGALLFLFSALLSRGLDEVQSDRDDAGQSLVTNPFGHASQEIVNLLLCGKAVSNVFDGNIDMGGGMFLKGVPTVVEVGFLTLLESLNLCTVGQNLKHPKWPIWVVGSESHYTVLFALSTSVQEENELEEREARIRQAFDSHDQSEGGGFITLDAFQQVLNSMRISFPQEVIDRLTGSEIVVWSDFWQALHQLDKNSGGLKDPDTGASGSQQFELFHFNGFAKSVGSSSLLVLGGSEAVPPRPRLCRLKVTVPPKWTPEEFMMDCKPALPPPPSDENKSPSADPLYSAESAKEPAQHAPLVDCVRARWQRATCNWSGDPPSIV